MEQCDLQGPRNGFYLGEARNFLVSIKISHCKNPLLDWPNLGGAHAHASVLHHAEVHNSGKILVYCSQINHLKWLSKIIKEIYNITLIYFHNIAAIINLLL